MADVNGVRRSTRKRKAINHVDEILSQARKRKRHKVMSKDVQTEEPQLSYPNIVWKIVGSLRGENSPGNLVINPNPTTAIGQNTVKKDVPLQEPQLPYSNIVWKIVESLRGENSPGNLVINPDPTTTIVQNMVKKDVPLQEPQLSYPNTIMNRVGTLRGEKSPGNLLINPSPATAVVQNTVKKDVPLQERPLSYPNTIMKRVGTLTGENSPSYLVINNETMTERVQNTMKKDVPLQWPITSYSDVSTIIEGACGGGNFPCNPVTIPKPTTTAAVQNMMKEDITLQKPPLFHASTSRTIARPFGGGNPPCNIISNPEQTTTSVVQSTMKNDVSIQTSPVCCSYTSSGKPFINSESTTATVSSASGEGSLLRDLLVKPFERTFCSPAVPVTMPNLVQQQNCMSSAVVLNISNNNNTGLDRKKGFFLMKLKRYQDIVSSCMRCKICGSTCEAVASRSSFDVVLQINCQMCGYVIYRDGPVFIADQLKTRLSEVNTVIAYQSLVRDTGIAECNKLASALGIPKFKHTVYRRYIKILYSKLLVEYKIAMSASHRRIVRYYKSLDLNPNERGILDICVDYSFQVFCNSENPRFQIGIGIIVETNTGLVVDTTVLWNFSCKSKMWNESLTAVKHMWMKSIVYGFRYHVVVRKYSSSVVRKWRSLSKELGLYENTDILYRDVIDHACTHFHQRLRTLRTKFLMESLASGGDLVALRKRAENLFTPFTDETISELTTFFRIAILNNLDKYTSEMSSAILARFYHCNSSDSNPQHTFCPKGEYSWCFYQRAKAMKVAAKSHKQANECWHLSKEESKIVKSAYMDLANPDHLQKCFSNNGPFLRKLWEKCETLCSRGLEPEHIMSLLESLT